MNRKILAAIAGIIIIIAIGYIFTIFVGNEYVFHGYNRVDTTDGKKPYALVEEGYEGFVEIQDVSIVKDRINVSLKSIKPGWTYIDVGLKDEATGEFEITDVAIICSHKNGVLTSLDFFGDFTGSRVVRLLIILYLAFVFWLIYGTYKQSMSENIYRYKNILFLGMLIFVGAMISDNLMHIVSRSGLIDMLMNMAYFMEFFAIMTFPIILVISVYVMASNVRLLRREGRTWRNMLGFFLGFLLCVASIAPSAISSFLQRTTLIDVHKWTGAGRFIGMFIEYLCAFIVVYFEAVLIGSIVMGIKAARNVPDFDKDYVLIHGCQIRGDGTLTKLLQSRADRAIEFAKLQKEKAGKDITFVPSGAKGSDEVISEAEAIKNYLMSTGIPEDKIMIEDRSENTEANIRNSIELIKEHYSEDMSMDELASKIAFSTSNYHAFRTGLLATKLGYPIQGLGSRTKSYFWINAFIREFIATLVSERRTHIAIIGLLILLVLTIVLMVYFSNVILSV